jgi:hypothetical protein
MQSAEFAEVADRAAQQRAAADFERWESGLMTEADHEAQRERALCDMDTLADWLNGPDAYNGGETAYHADHDARALIDDYANAAKLGTPELLALALGLTPYPKARIAAMNELSARYMRHVNEQKRRSLGACGDALKAFGFPEVRS